MIYWFVNEDYVLHCVTSSFTNKTTIPRSKVGYSMILPVVFIAIYFTNPLKRMVGDWVQPCGRRVNCWISAIQASPSCLKY